MKSFSVGLATGVAGLLAYATGCVARGYPNKTIRVIIPFAPGGGTDILTRTIAPKLSEALGQQLVIDNRAGGGSTIGSEMVAKSVADGYTLLMVDTSFTTNPSLYSKLPDIQQRLIDLGFDPIGGTPEQFAANIKSETEKWARVIKNARVKLD